MITTATPFYPHALALQFEGIYKAELAKVTDKKKLVKEVESLFLLESEVSFTDRILKWTTAFLLWHKRKIKRIYKDDNLLIADTVDSSIIDGFVKTNAELITDISSASLTSPLLHKAVAKIIKTKHGLSQAGIAETIKKVTGASENKAVFWARDQVTKLNGDIDKHKYKQSGLDKYIWLTSGGARVRPTHRVLHGKLRTLGEGLEPQVDYNCRCAMKIATAKDIANGGLAQKYIDRENKRWKEIEERGL